MSMREDWIQHIELHPEEYPATFKALGNKLIVVPTLKKAKDAMERILEKIKLKRKELIK